MKLIRQTSSETGDIEIRKAKILGHGKPGEASDSPLHADILAAVAVAEVELDKIYVDPDLVVRVTRPEEAIADYAENLDRLPPIDAFDIDGTITVVDGVLRLAAYQKAGKSTVPVRIHEGSREEAILFAVGANAAHGVRRTNQDKRRAVSMLLARSGWINRSDEWVAARSCVSRPFVAKVRRSLETVPSDGPTVPRLRRGLDGRVTNTARIGKSKSASCPQPESAPSVPTATTPPDSPRTRLPVINSSARITVEPAGGRARVLLAHLHEITSMGAYVENRSEGWLESLRAIADGQLEPSAEGLMDTFNASLAIATVVTTLTGLLSTAHRAVAALSPKPSGDVDTKGE